MIDSGRVRVDAAERAFDIVWDVERWVLDIGAGREAAAYGLQIAITRLEWRASGRALELDLRIRPASGSMPP